MHKQRGFTLIQLLVVIIFIIVIALMIAGEVVVWHFIAKVW